MIGSYINKPRGRGYPRPLGRFWWISVAVCFCLAAVLRGLLRTIVAAVHRTVVAAVAVALSLTVEGVARSGIVYGEVFKESHVLFGCQDAFHLVQVVAACLATRLAGLGAFDIVECRALCLGQFNAIERPCLGCGTLCGACWSAYRGVAGCAACAVLGFAGRGARGQQESGCQRQSDYRFLHDSRDSVFFLIKPSLFRRDSTI